MTRLVNAPADFPAEALRGFVPASKCYVKPVYDGIIRSTAIPQGRVAVIYGGGSGYYLAFAGWVGAGIADGAVCGNIFSPFPGARAYSVLKVADRGAGALMGFGNYAGNVPRFGQAIERLRSERIPADTLAVTDDITSGAKDELGEHRDIVGDFLVFKITGAAAKVDKDFEEVKRIFAKASMAMRSLGVAFSDRAPLGADDPLFTAPAGKMGIGLGIHGKPGVSEDDLGSTDDVVATLVEGLLGDHPESAGNRVIAIANGLGDTKYEELFAVVGFAVDRLKAASVEIADVKSGESVTSLDMTGVSFTLAWVDDELLSYRDAPCDTPAYRKGFVDEVERDGAELNSAAATVVVTEKGSESSREATDIVVGLLEKVSGMFEEPKGELGKLDSIAGDGDHGIGTANGSKAAAQAAWVIADQGVGVATTLSVAGNAWSDRASGTSGALWGSLLTVIGAAPGNEEAPSFGPITDAAIVGRSAVQRFGGAQVGDETMVDALVPLVDAFVPIDDDLKAKGEATVAAGQAGAKSTAQLAVKLGRARPFGEKSLGTPDPGAVSLVRAVEVVVEQT